MNILNPTYHFGPTKNNLVYLLSSLPLKMLLTILMHEYFRHLNIVIFIDLFNLMFNAINIYLIYQFK
jgi:hypothetical protein